MRWIWISTILRRNIMVLLILVTWIVRKKGFFVRISTFKIFLQSNMWQIMWFMTTMGESHCARSLRCVIHWNVLWVKSGISHRGIHNECPHRWGDVHTTSIINCPLLMCLCRFIFQSSQLGWLSRGTTTIQWIPECISTSPSLHSILHYTLISIEIRCHQEYVNCITPNTSSIHYPVGRRGRLTVFPTSRY